MHIFMNCDLGFLRDRDGTGPCVRVMNGWQFLHEVGRDDELTGLPVVVLSAMPEPAGLDGVFDVIAKPFTYERLLLAVERACA
jgi:CheY-like chemotaxis protein